MLNDDEFFTTMEMLMARKIDKLEIMKILCLYSATHGGIFAKKFT